jgi:hypothetical protein
LAEDQGFLQGGSIYVPNFIQELYLALQTLKYPSGLEKTELCPKYFAV